MASALIIGTTLPGHGGRVVTERVANALRAAGWSVEARMARDPAALDRFGRDGAASGADVVVAIGGDGTILRVAAGLAGSETSLAIVPTGTGNLLAGNLGVGPHPMDAIRAIVRGTRRRIDLGCVRSQPTASHFAVAAGIGFDARVMAATPPTLKRRFGKFAYILMAAALAGSLRNVDHEITVDGHTFAIGAAQVLVANFGELAPHLRANWSIEPDDGLLDVVIVPAMGAIGGLAAAWDALGPRLGRGGPVRIRRLRARAVRVVADRPLPVEVDGDVIGRTPLEIGIVPGALSVVVPER